jgi:hypothetical protein
MIAVGRWPSNRRPASINFVPPRFHAGGVFPGRAMVKETKFFRKQAAKAERMARAVSDSEISERFLNMAKAYRSQADVLKAKKRSGKKRR